MAGLLALEFSLETPKVAPTEFSKCLVRAHTGPAKFMLRVHKESIFQRWRPDLICGAAEIAAIDTVRGNSEIANSRSAGLPVI